MSYTDTLERLKKLHDGQGEALTKPTKAPSVSNVSPPPGPSENFPDRETLAGICRQAVADYPDIDPARLRRFIEVAEDPEWCNERVARHIARRMSEGFIREGNR